MLYLFVTPEVGLQLILSFLPTVQIGFYYWDRVLLLVFLEVDGFTNLAQRKRAFPLITINFTAFAKFCYLMMLVKQAIRQVHIVVRIVSLLLCSEDSFVFPIH
jgi:hypothetical protein